MTNDNANVLQILRNMRNYTNTYTHDVIENMWADYAKMESAGADVQTLGSRLSEINMIHHTAQLCRVVLTCAARAEKQEKGGGVRWYIAHQNDIAKIKNEIKKMGVVCDGQQ